MSISMRLSRGGSKKRPYYKIVVANSRAPRDGKYLEQIGVYNPLLAKDSGERVKLNEERAKHWLSVGAQPTDRVARFLDTLGIKERKPTVNLKKGEPGEKAKERAQLALDKAAEAEEAAKQAELEAAEAAAAAAAAPAVDETPAPAVAAEEAAEVAADDAAAAGEGADVAAADATVAEDAATGEEPTA